MGKIKDGLQLLIVRTSFPPFVVIYKLYYVLAIRIMTYFIKRIDGVETLYLRRGVAKNEIVYGLSDIDLSVLVSDKNVNYSKTKVLSLYNRLNFFLPLFSGSREEIGIYSKQEFFELYEGNPFFKFRFQKGKSEWKLLYGKDIVSELPDCDDDELYVPAIEELKLWWNKLNFEFQKKSILPEFKKTYLWYKAIADASQVYLFVCRGEKTGSREISLAKIKEYSDGHRKRVIAKLHSLPKNFSHKKSIGGEEFLTMYMDLANEVIQKAEKEMPKWSQAKKALLKTIGYSDLIIGKNSAEAIARLENFVNAELPDFLSSVAVFPQIYFGPDICFNTDIDSLNFVLVPKKFIPIDKLRSLKSLVEKNDSFQKIDIFVHYRSSSFSIHSDAGWESIKTPMQNPFFFSLLGKCSISEIREDKTQELFSERTPDFIFVIKKRADMIKKMISDREIYKMSPLNFSRFFWAAVRTKALNSSLNNDIIPIPLNSVQIMMFLKKHYPQSGWISEFYIEYRKELQGMESEVCRFYDQMLGCLERM